MEACTFCDIAAGRLPASEVLDEPALMAFLDARPVFAGHTLVIPRRHATTVEELSVPMLGGLFEAARRVAGAQRRALGAEGTFFALNNIVSQSVPHVHLHVVPRRQGDGLRGVLWPRRRYGEGEAQQVAQRLRAELAATAAEEGTPKAELATTAADPPPAKVRTAGRADLAALVDLLAAGSLLPGEDASALEQCLEALEEIWVTPGSEVLVAESEGVVAGMCQLITFRHLQQRGGRCAEIESVHVAERFRGLGIGSALVSAALERARSSGCYRVQLTSNKSRQRAHRFYERLGFEATHEGYKLYL
jgi:histidine triad (HIT) family protein